MRTSGIYKIQSKIKPERIYVGSAVDIGRRCVHLNHLQNNKHHSKKLQRHYNKYGEADLIFIIVELCSPEFLTVREQYYIDKLKPYYNCCFIAGSCLGVKRSEETKRKLSVAWKKREPVSEETKRKISNGHKGINTWMKGRSPSEQTRKKISEANKGKIKTKESIEKFRKSRIGHSVSEETRRKISESNKGRKHSEKEILLMRLNNIGKHSGKLSEESKQRLRESHIAFYKTAKGEEIKQNLIKINTGKKASIETRKKMSEAGKKKTFSPEYRKNLRDAWVIRKLNKLSA